MDKEQLIKLAEVAGVTVKEFQIVSSHNSVLRVDHCCGSIWRPNEDIAQAIEVLEGLGNDNVFLSKSSIKTDVSWEVEIWDIGLEDESIIIVSDSLTLAICQAVLKATEQGNG